MSKVKNLKYYIAFSIQVIILGFLTLSLFGEKKTVELDASAFGGVGEYRDGEWFIDESYGAADPFLTSGELSLPAGVYKVQLFYETDTEMVNYCSISDPFAAHGQVLGGGEHLYSGLDSTDYDVWVFDGNGSLVIQVNYGGSGTVAVQGARVYDTGALQRMLLFATFILFIIMDGLWLYYQRKKVQGISAEQKVTVLALGIIIVYSSLPLLTDYIMHGGDLIFHLHRIEGVKDGLLSGQFPVRIAPEWIRGYGYASSIFYGDTMLGIPALLRLMGFSVQTSYKVFLFLINLGTCLISYFAFKKIFSHRIIGVLCSMLYTMSIYRMHMAYRSARVGELLGIMFIPLIVAGLYKIFTEDVKDKKYRWNWVLPTIGFCGIIQSHILSTYIVGMFVLLLCAIMWKKVLRKETFLVLGTIVVFSSVVCAWFIVPFLDYMAEGVFVINNVSGRLIQYRGLQVAQLLKVFYFSGNNVYFYEGGMVDAEPLGLGGALLLGLCVFLVLSWTGRMGNIDKKLIKLGKIATFIAVITMVMSTNLFPWDRIQRINSLTGSLVSSLEFPSRFLNIATIALVLVTGVVGLCIWKMDSQGWKIGFITALMAMFLVGNVLVVNDICNRGNFTRLYNPEEMGTGYISGEEYLIVGTNISTLWYRDANPGETVNITEYEKNYLSAELKCVNNSEAESYIDLPILYYEGYRAQSDTGEKLEVCAGENNVVRVIIPGDFEGNVSVEFVSPWYWRAAEIVSVLFTLVLIGACCQRKRKEKLSWARSQS